MIRAEYKVHGGKTYFWREIFHYAPADRDLTFIEPYGGSGVLTYNSPFKRNIWNDLDRHKYAVKWSIFNCVDLLILRLLALTYSKDTFEAYQKRLSVEADLLETAINYLVVSRMSENGEGKRFSWSDRTRRGMPEQIAAWKGMIERLSQLSSILRTKCDISNLPAVKLIKMHKSEDKFIYLDPTYLTELRESKKNYGRYEMNYMAHVDLLRSIQDHPAKIMVSGYDDSGTDSKPYSRYLEHWRKVVLPAVSNAGRTTVKEVRLETIWMNYSC